MHIFVIFPINTVAAGLATSRKIIPSRGIISTGIVVAFVIVLLAVWPRLVIAFRAYWEAKDSKDNLV